MASLVAQVCHHEVVAVAGSSHRMLDLRAQGQTWMVGVETVQKSVYPAEHAVLSSHCRDFHPYGHSDGHHCCGGGFDGDLGRGARRGHCYALDHVVVHVRHCVLRPYCALGGGLCSGHALCWYLMVVGAARRQVEEESVSLWV